MKRQVCTFLAVALMVLCCFSATSCSNSQDYEPNLSYVSKETAISLSKSRFEQSLASDNSISKFYSPKYGKCDVSDKGDYWYVQLRGSYNYYTDPYASGRPKERNFTKSYSVPKYMQKIGNRYVSWD